MKGVNSCYILGWRENIILPSCSIALGLFFRASGSLEELYQFDTSMSWKKNFLPVSKSPASGHWQCLCLASETLHVARCARIILRC